ncbi:MAG: helical backbone metal receptor, partial [Myxococcota bacterium]
SRAVAPVPTFVPIWLDPLMTVHGSTFVSDVVELAGGANVFADRRRRYPLRADLGARPAVDKPGRDTRYPRVRFDEVIERAPSLLLLPDEPFAFTADHAADFARRLGPSLDDFQIELCSGKELMWYGFRSLEGIDAVVAALDRRRERKVSSAG